MNAVRTIFERLTGGLDYPMLIVTTAVADRRAGCLVGFATQCSIDPPRFLVCISDKNHTCAVARDADAMAIHFPPAGAMHLARLFGSETGDRIDKFARCRWRRGPGELPILEECGRWFAGRILERRRLGDHFGFVLDPFAAEDDGRTDTLASQDAMQLEPGHDA
jgi:flavin reductase (DIM6/NTAB) family NADH-FMN oxidoreductase RutF